MRMDPILFKLNNGWTYAMAYGGIGKNGLKLIILVKLTF
jgi:hypothetical protein